MKFVALTRITIACIVALLVLAGEARAQYSQSAFDLKKSSDLYDERGFSQGKAVTVDGSLVVSQSNGNVSYSYPISNYSVNGFPFQVTLNYCGSVSFTAFKSYKVARDADYMYQSQGELYGGWEKFHQNRPAWILGVNGFAVQVLSTSNHFVSHAAPRVFDRTQRNFDDSDFLFMCDGYDFCNRMVDFGADGSTEAMGPNFVDNIRLLRADGSVLELVNIHVKEATHPDRRPELYTGYYLPMEANARGYAVVTFDSTRWPFSAYCDGIDCPPLLPREVRYYPEEGGTELVFRERVMPYGANAYHTYDSATGGKYGGPTIFYLEEINGPGQRLQGFLRPRHYPRSLFLNSGVDEDTTRGRAPLWQFGDHTLSFGANAMTIQAFGRTTQVKFDKVLPGGNATETDWMPIASNGILSEQSRDMANYAESNPELYKSWLGYVTEIIDPEGRKTTFTYEPYVRKYLKPGFPHNDGQNETLTLTNLRLKEIKEPTAQYRISYYKAPCIVDCGNDYFHVASGGDTLTISSSDGTDKELPRLSNMAAIVEKRDLAGTLLSTDRYHFLFPLDGEPFAATTRHIAIDAISHDTVTTENTYLRFELPEFSPKLPKPKFTAISRVRTTATSPGTPAISTVKETSYSSNTTPATINVFGGSYDVSSSGWGTPFMVLGIAHKEVVNGIIKSRQVIDYTLDTVRRYGANTALAGLFGRDVTQKVTKMLIPNTGALWLKQTTDYLHLPLVDTTGTTIYRLPLKFAAWAAWDSLKAIGAVDPALGYEYAFNDPRAARYGYDTAQWSVRVPPIFGLELRTVTRDANDNYLAGKASTYHTSYNANTQESYVRRGVRLADTMIGTGGTQKIVAGIYGYDSNSWRYSRFVSQTRNANGAITRISRWYGFLDEPFVEPSAKVLDNRDSVGVQGLRGAVYGNMTEEPLAERHVVRRATPEGTIDTVKLTQYSERTFHGLIGGAMDYNGWYSRFDYDHNGRLNAAWFPYDFQGSDSTWMIDQRGFDSSETYGTTSYGVYHGVVVCDVEDYLNDPERPLPQTETITRHGELFANYPVNSPAPSCPPCNEGHAKGHEQTILATCKSAITYDSVHAAIGVMNIPVVPPRTQAILSLDSAWMQLFVTSVIGNCVNLKVSVPDLGIEKIYVLNCPPGGGVDGSGSPFLNVDLSEAKEKLLDYAPGQGFAATVEVTSAGGHVEFVSGFESHDLRPRLMLAGEFRRINHLADYTLAYSYDDDSLTSEVAAKVDDERHTANELDPVALMGESRRTRSKHYFGPDGRILKSEATIAQPWGTTRIDSVRHTYTGFARRTTSVDQLGDSVITKYDGFGQPVETINQDGSKSTIAYRYGTPASFGLTGQDFHGFAAATITKNEHGVKHVRYTDAFGRLRREVADSGAGGHLNLTTKYEYDLLGRLTMVINPKGDSTLYWYDAFGRVRKKRHPDLNVVSHAYDDLGNVRFTQSQEQANRQRLTFNQYDDLNRLVLVGEANFAYFYNEDSIDISHAQPNGTAKEHDGAGILHNVPEPETWRYTDILDPRRLHDNGTSPFLTANTTLWMNPIRPVPEVSPNFSINVKNCPLPPNALLGETSSINGPFIVRPAAFYNSGWMPVADTLTFEHLSDYPEFPRIAIHYDTLPTSQGPIWSGFPTAGEWDQLAPTGAVRNLKGREAVVAYRERSADPYHYAVMSYDERGRVEALLHFTENLGFDAVYYTYNSMNQITSVRVADYLRQHATWYGYDANGRTDSVWTSLEGVGSGLFSNLFGIRYPAPPSRPDTADIVYRYTKMGQVDTMKYPQVDVLVDYAYNRRKWLDSLVATQGGTNLFRQALKYHPTGQIVEQQWQHDTNARRKQTYTYDSLQQLVEWTDGNAGSTTPGSSTQYTYDNIGNRLASGLAPAGGGAVTSAYTYPAQASRLLSNTTTDASGATIANYWYNYNGSQIRRARSFDSVAGGVRPLGMEEHGWSYRELARRFVTYNGASQMEEDWRYRPNAQGEREQKRVYWLPQSDAAAMYPWVYYQLGGGQKQLAVYHGQQTSAPMCGDTGQRVYLYPTEYLTYSISDASNLVTRPTGAKEYKIADHLGSTRVVVDAGGVLAASDYEPFGEPITVAGAVTGMRKGFIDKEKDAESGDYNAGLRQLNDPRFLSIDPKWEKFRSTSPYAYSFNNPLRYLDPDGDDPFTLISGMSRAGVVGVGLAVVTIIAIQSDPGPIIQGANAGLTTSVLPQLPGATFETNAGDLITIPAQMIAESQGWVFLGLLALAADDGPDEPLPLPAPEGGGELPPPLGVEALPDLTGKSREEAAKALEDVGFGHKSTTKGGYEKWAHPDGSLVWIDPNGVIDRIGPRVWLPDGSKKYPPRYGPDGRRRGSDEPHDTGEILND